MSDKKQPAGLEAWLEYAPPPKFYRITPELSDRSRRLAEALARGETVIDLGSEGVPVIEVTQCETTPREAFEVLRRPAATTEEKYAALKLLVMQAAISEEQAKDTARAAQASSAETMLSCLAMLWADGSHSE